MMDTYDIKTNLLRVIDRADVVLSHPNISSQNDYLQMANNAKATALLGLIELKKLEVMQRGLETKSSNY